MWCEKMSKASDACLCDVCECVYRYSPEELVVQGAHDLRQLPGTGGIEPETGATNVHVSLQRCAQRVVEPARLLWPVRVYNVYGGTSKAALQ